MADDRPGSAETILVVAAALVDDRGRVLVQQRPVGSDHAGLWEFPGGKVEPGEKLRRGLARELAEELGIDVDVPALAPLGFATARTGARELVLLLFGCGDWAGEPRPIHAAAIRWVAAGALADLAMPPVDVELLGVAHAYARSRQAGSS